MNSPVVSVVIPVRNHAAYLAEAIESVLAQTRPVAEVLVVDDGSTDGSPDVAEAFGAPVRVLSRPPAGWAAARNTGVAASGGAVLAFLDADDVWPRERLAAMLDRLEAADRPDLVFGHLEEFRTPEAEAASLPAPRAASPATMTTTLLLDRMTLDRVGPFAADTPVGDFAPWLARARALGLREVMIDAVVTRRRLHPMNVAAWQERRSQLATAIRASLAERRSGAL